MWFWQRKRAKLLLNVHQNEIREYIRSRKKNRNQYSISGDYKPSPEDIERWKREREEREKEEAKRIPFRTLVLQKLEEYEGIIILATNFLQNFDNAFCRRFKFIIEFPFPDEQRRLEIWNHVFPEKMEIAEEIDTQWLAEEFKFSGSHIKNIALAASFLAAGENTGLTMKHVLTALKREQQKVGKQMIAS